MILAIDFDGVIHDYKNPIEGKRMGAPIVGAREALVKFREQGHRIIIFTVWDDPSKRKAVSDFMNFYHIPYHEITNIKPQADYYIDDKAIPFRSWSSISI